MVAKILEFDYLGSKNQKNREKNLEFQTKITKKLEFINYFYM